MNVPPVRRAIAFQGGNCPTLGGTTTPTKFRLSTSSATRKGVEPSGGGICADGGDLEFHDSSQSSTFLYVERHPPRFTLHPLIEEPDSVSFILAEW